MRRLFSLSLWIATISTTLIVQAQKDIQPPETFTANAQALGRNAGASAVTIQIDQIDTSESDRATIQEALRVGGFPGFLPRCAVLPRSVGSR